MNVQLEKQEMLDSWAQNAREENLSYFQKKYKEDGFRRTARFDASRDKLELKDENTTYFKRKK